MLKTRSLLILFALAALIFTSVGVSAQDVPEGEVSLAVLGPFTGPVASIGEEILNWSQLAVDDFNERTGWNVTIVEGDTELDPAKGVLAAEAVIANENVFGATGPAGSQVVAATAAMFEAANLVHVSASATDPSLTQDGTTTFFRVVPTDAVQGPTDANFLANDLGVTRLFIIDDQSTYSVGLSDQVEAAFPGEIVGRESITQDDSDFSALVTRIRNEDVEAIFFPGQIASQGAVLAQQLAEQGVDVIFMGADGFFSPEDFVEGAGGATEGAYVSFFAPDIHNLESSADVVARYTDRFGDFGAFGPPAYAAATVVLEAMERAFEANGELTREGVLAEVANTNQETTILGIPLSFDENGDVAGGGFSIFQIQDGEFVFVTSVNIGSDEE